MEVLKNIDWQEVIKSLGLFSIGFGFLVWLVKILGKYAIDKRLVAYKEELSLKSKEYQSLLNADLETHKAKLNIEHTQYQKLQEKRLEIMAEIYKKIAELDIAMNYLVQEFKLLKPEQSSEELNKHAAQSAHNAYNTFYLYYLNHKIFFSEANCELLEEMQKKYWDSLWDGTTRQRLGNTDFDFTRSNMKKAAKTVREDIPQIKFNLEVEFRNALGVK